VTDSPVSLHPSNPLVDTLVSAPGPKRALDALVHKAEPRDGALRSGLLLALSLGLLSETQSVNQLRQFHIDVRYELCATSVLSLENASGPDLTVRA